MATHKLLLALALTGLVGYGGSINIGFIDIYN
jgi:hypothetical protein